MALAQARRIIEETERAPRCTRCGGLTKSAVISFGQPMRQKELVQSEQLARMCDLFLVLGSSLVVQPAATLPMIAKNNGAALVIVNNQPTPLDPIADQVINQPLGKTLQKALEKARL